MKSILSRITSRIGLTGKLLLLVGLILLVCLGSVLTLIHFRARATIRNELRKLEVARIQQWAAINQSAIQGDDQWKVSRALVELMDDPYVIYAGFYDPAGALVAHEGDREAYTRPGTLDLLVGLKGGAVGFPVGEEIPLPGLADEAPAVGGPLPAPQRIRRALAEATRDPENNFGWIAVTLSTRPLDGLAGQVLVPLAMLCGFLLLPALALTWWVARRATVPLGHLRTRAEEIANGDLSGTYDSIPRPSDEIGSLATGFSIMAGKLKRSQERMDADARTLALAVAQDRQSVRKVIHDLKNPAASIVAFSEILSDEPPAEESERARFLKMIRGEADRLVHMLESFSAAGEALLAPGTAAHAGDSVGRKVILATDDPGIRAVLRKALDKEGFEVEVASNLEDCIRAAREGAPRAVLVDLLMKEGAGFAALGELRRAPTISGIPVISMAVVRNGDRFGTAPIHFQTKPVKKEALLKAARLVLKGDGTGASVLVVDDDKFVAEGIRQLLGREGFKASTAQGGEEGLRQAEKNPPDLVVVDLSMPGLDGIGMIKRLRSSPQTLEIPILVTTGQDIPNGSALSWPDSTVNAEGLAAGLSVALREATAD